MTRRPVAGPAPAPGASSRWMIPALLVLVALPVGGALATAVAHASGGQGAGQVTSRAGSAVVDAHPSTPLLPDHAPGSYEITYEVVDSSSGKPDTTTERVSVRRPFDGLVETRSGRPPGTDLRGDRTTSLMRLTTSTPASGPRGFAVAPTVAARDLRFGPVLQEAVARGTVIVRERRRVAGRECQVYRVGSSVLSGTLTPYAAGSDEWADACVDRAGLLLEEVWTLHRHPVVRRLATSVREEIAFDDALFHTGDAGIIPPDQGGGLSRRVDPASGPNGEYLSLPTAPEGFDYIGRFGIAAPQGASDPRTSGGNVPTSASVVDLWVRGADFVVLEQGASTKPLAPLTDPRAVDLGPLGQAQAGLDLRGNELRLPSPDGGFTRVVGTLPIDDLATIARALTPTQGTGLRFVGG